MRGQKGQPLWEAKRAEKRTAEEITQSARDQARRQANSARERVIEDNQEAMKLKANKQPLE